MLDQFFYFPFFSQQKKHLKVQIACHKCWKILVLSCSVLSYHSFCLICHRPLHDGRHWNLFRAPGMCIGLARKHLNVQVTGFVGIYRETWCKIIKLRRKKKRCFTKTFYIKKKKTSKKDERINFFLNGFK